MATDKLPEMCFGMCGVGDLEVTDDGHKVTFTWKVHVSYVRDFPRMSSRWCQCRGGQYRLCKFNHNGSVYLALMKEKPSFFGYDLKMGLIADDQEKFCVSGQIAPSTCFIQQKLVTLDNFNELVHDGHVKFFAEIRKKRNIECIPGTSTANTDEKGVGTSASETEDKAVGTSWQSLGARPKGIHNTKSMQVYREESVKAAGTSGTTRKDAEKIKRAEEAGAVRTESRGTVCREVFNPPGRKLEQDLRKLLQEGFGADVLFLLKDGECRAHSVVLSVRWPYFQSEIMMDGTVSFADCTARGFAAYIDYVYTGTVDMVTPANAFEVLFVAEKFGDERLKTECLESMPITLDNFIQVEEFLLKCYSEKLSEAAFRFFCKNKCRIEDASRFERFLQEHPDIVSRLFLKELRN